ncbi:MAG: right-handed parallel beta-helix repeat-containing protein [Thermoguttaceae bacterium]|nr:right-handed parallel beta-helix repeat-containing protein [Thermoguttaceae bacterium]
MSRSLVIWGLALNSLVAFSLFSLVCAFGDERPEFVKVLYVSNEGDDANSGDRDAPLLSLERARDVGRELRGQGVDGWIQIQILDDELALERPLILDARDSNTVYSGCDSTTTLSGGVTLVGWRLASDEEKTPFPNKDAEIWVVDLPKDNDETIYGEQLFVNDRRAIRARFPNDGFLTPESVWEEFPMNPQNRSVERPTTRQELRAKEGELDSLRLEEIPKEEMRFAQFIVHHHWDTTRRIVLGFNSETRALLAQGAPMKSWNPWRDTSLYYLENLRSAFDAPGEWFYDGVRARVFYRPLNGETIDATSFTMPRPGLNQLLVVNSNDGRARAHDVRFERLRFAYTDAPRREATMREAALPDEVAGPLEKPGPSQFEPAQSAFFTVATLSVANADRVVFYDCSVNHVGEYGLWFKDCSDCKADRVDFTDLGAGAVRVGGGSMDRGNTVSNCVMTQGGRFFAAATAVWTGQNTEEIAILHNDISDFYYTGVSVGWVWGYNGGHAFRNRIEFNKISRIGQGALSDMGGVYTLGTSTGTRVCNNVIYDVSSYAYGGWGLYPDEGSEGILFENNLVYDTTDGSFHQHYGKDNVVRNNILARSKTNPARAGQPPHQLAITRVEDHLSTVFERNIIYWKDGIALGYNADAAKTVFSKNLWFNAGGEALFSGMSHGEWADLKGKDQDGLVADPLFVDPDANDFHLRPESPAFKLGFVPFEYERAGVEPRE